MATGKGIPGIAVVMGTAGALLLYAGFQGLNPLTALRALSTGKTKPLVKTSSYVSSGAPSATGGGSGGVVSTGYTTTSGSHPEILQAAGQFKDDLYSQSKRWQDGYSDCSSFVGKTLKSLGIAYPGNSVTGNYLVWNQLRTIKRSEIVAGDLLCGSGHIAIAIDSQHAVGQQNSRENVKADTIDNIMWGQSGWIPRRYVGPSGGNVMAA